MTDSSASEPIVDEPTPASADASSATPAIGLGVALLLIGGLLFVGQLLDIGIDDVGWPAIVIGIGVVILVLGLFVNREQGMVIGGTVVTTVGLVLLYQDQTGRWETWAYAWALVGPAASGLGMVLWGIRTADPVEIRNGTWALLGGPRDLRRRLPLLRGRDRDQRRATRPSRVGSAGRGDRDRRRRARPRDLRPTRPRAHLTVAGGPPREAQPGAVSLRRDARDRPAPRPLPIRSMS